MLPEGYDRAMDTADNAVIETVRAEGRLDLRLDKPAIMKLTNGG